MPRLARSVLLVGWSVGDILGRVNLCPFLSGPNPPDCLHVRPLPPSWILPFSRPSAVLFTPVYESVRFPLPITVRAPPLVNNLSFRPPLPKRSNARCPFLITFFSVLNTSSRLPRTFRNVVFLPITDSGLDTPFEDSPVFCLL